MSAEIDSLIGLISKKEMRISFLKKPRIEESISIFYLLVSEKLPGRKIQVQSPDMF